MPKKYFETGKFLKKARIGARLSRQDVAEDLGIYSQYVCSWERGMSIPSDSIFERVVEIYKLDKSKYVAVLMKDSRNSVEELVYGKKMPEETDSNQEKNVEGKYIHSGKLLKDARIGAGLTQQDVAEKIERHPQYVSNWERGQCLPGEAIMADVLIILKVSRVDLDKALVADSKIRIEELIFGKIA